MDVAVKTKKSLYWVLVSRAVFEAFRFGTSIFVARILNPRDFGIISIATMVLYYANTITNLGFNQALVQRKEITDKHVNSVFVIDLAISVALIGVFFFLAPHIATFFASEESGSVIRVMSVIFLLTTFYDLPYTLYRRSLDFKLISVIDAAREIAVAALTLLLAMGGFQYWSMVWGSLIPQLCATAFIIVKVRWRPRLSYDHASLKELFDFGVWSFLRSQVIFLSNRVDRVITGVYFGPAVLGLYEKAKSLSALPKEGVAANINTVFFSAFSRNQQEESQFRQMLRKGFTVTAVLCFPIYFGLYGVADHFVLLALGEKWAGVIVPLKIMCAGGVIDCLNGIFATFNVGVGSYRNYTVRLLGSTVLFALGTLVIGRWGIAYVAVCYMLSAAIHLGLNIDLLRKRVAIGWDEFSQCVLPALVCCTAMLAGVQYLARVYSSTRTLLNLAAIVGVGVAIYCVAILIYPSEALAAVRRSVLDSLRARG